MQAIIFESTGFVCLYFKNADKNFNKPHFGLTAKITIGLNPDYKARLFRVPEAGNDLILKITPPTFTINFSFSGT